MENTSEFADGTEPGGQWCLHAAHVAQYLP